MTQPLSALHANTLLLTNRGKAEAAPQPVHGRAVCFIIFLAKPIRKALEETCCCWTSSTRRCPDQRAERGVLHFTNPLFIIIITIIIIIIIIMITIIIIIIIIIIIMINNNNNNNIINRAVGQPKESPSNGHHCCT